MNRRKIALFISVMAMSVAIAAGCKKEVPETEVQTQTETMQIETETETETEAETQAVLPEGQMYSFLTGDVVDVEAGMERPVALMINNVPEALPQSGISQAGILYEAVVESDITRLMAVFETTEGIEKVGPIRSCRHNYLDFAHDEEAVYGHFGWSYAAEDRINAEGLKTLNFMFGQPNSVYYRSSDRVAPHNVYTTGEMLENAKVAFGADTQIPEGYEGRLKFNSEDTAIETGEDAYNVSVSFSSKTQFTYDEANKVYLKSQYGDKHIDAVTGEQLAFKNIIIQKAVYTQFNGDILKDIAVVGTGEGMYISDGKAVNITWKKDDLSDHTRYYLEDGTELKLNAGKTYIGVVPTEYSINISGK